ncbi:hypothetical protein Ct61P_09719 [Colletotrichum tofieldiae]|nr:hypothetical protein Ct61P_09719 [Colletotrichum tofieldiae]
MYRKQENHPVLASASQAFSVRFSSPPKTSTLRLAPTAEDSPPRKRAAACPRPWKPSGAHATLRRPPPVSRRGPYAGFVAAGRGQQAHSRPVTGTPHRGEPLGHDGMLDGPALVLHRPPLELRLPPLAEGQRDGADAAGLAVGPGAAARVVLVVNGSRAVR